MNVLPFPRPQPCHACTQPYVGSSCPTCKTERPAFTALKAISAKQPECAFERSVGALPTCPYNRNALCNCSLRGACLPAA